MLFSKEQALCLLVTLLTSCTLDMKSVKNSLLGVYENSFLFTRLDDNVNTNTFVSLTFSSVWKLQG